VRQRDLLAAIARIDPIRIQGTFEQRAIDIGSGPGLLACEMAVAVGTGGRICGVDVSENMLALARARRPPAGSSPIEYQEAGAHTLPYADVSFDVAVCKQVTRLLRDAGLEVTDRQIVPLFNAGYDPNTYSAGMLELIATFVPDRNGVSQAEATAWAQDLTELGPNYFLSLNRYLFLAHKPT
jgi:SAM-dependent methyltransferase